MIMICGSLMRTVIIEFTVVLAPVKPMDVILFDVLAPLMVAVTATFAAAPCSA